MKLLLNILLLLICYFITSLSNIYAQKAWQGKLELNSLDCETNTVCYSIGIKSWDETSWALGDHNYRLFYDAKNASVLSVSSLLPTSTYSDAQLDEVLELVGQGQEEFSPLNNIDENLGFVDFSVIAYNKQNPLDATQINNEGYLSLVEICFEISDDLIQGNAEGAENAMNIFVSRESTAGMITNQYIVLTEIDSPNHTIDTKMTSFIDMTYYTNGNAVLSEVCALLSNNETLKVEKNILNISPNPVLNFSEIYYESSIQKTMEHTIRIHDAQGKAIASFQNLPIGNNKIRLKEELSTGIYFFTLLSIKGKQIQEVVIMSN